MELITKISTKIAGRELLCDCCGEILAKEGINEKEQTFFVTLWRSRKTYYIEKFICEKCKKYFDNAKEINPQLLPYQVKKTINELILRNYYGYITALRSWEEFEVLLKNPELIKFLGEKF